MRCLLFPGALRGQINLPTYSGSSFLAGSASTAVGFGTAAVVSPTQLSLSLTLVGVSGQSAAHVHAVSNGAVICGPLPVGSFVNVPCNVTADQMAAVKGLGTYFNVHTLAQPRCASFSLPHVQYPPPHALVCVCALPVVRSVAASSCLTS